MIGTDLIFQLIDTSCIVMILAVELVQLLADRRSKALSESIAEITLPTMAVNTNKPVQ